MSYCAIGLLYYILLDSRLEAILRRHPWIQTDGELNETQGSSCHTNSISTEFCNKILSFCDIESSLNSGNMIYVSSLILFECHLQTVNLFSKMVPKIKVGLKY